MPSGRTTRRLLDYPLTTDAYKPSGDIKALAEQLDNDAETGQGTLAERPAAKTRGRLFYVTGDIAENNNILWWDTGSTWVRSGSSPEYAENFIVRIVGTGYQVLRTTQVLATLEMAASGSSQTAQVTVGPTSEAGVFIAGIYQVPPQTTASRTTLTFNLPAGWYWKASTPLLSVHSTYVYL